MNVPYQKTTFEDVISLYKKFLSEEFPVWKKMKPNDYQSMMAEFDKTVLVFALSKTTSMLKASSYMGVNRNTIRSRIRKYNIPNVSNLRNSGN